ncbi:hypothetical protein U9M48_001680, partial [Paspalum notatum var. saurae]
MNVELIEGNDVFSWKLHRNMSFSLRSMYKHLINNNISVSQDIWRQFTSVGSSRVLLGFMGTRWLQLWAKLQRSEERTQMIVEGCRRMET